MLFRSFSAILRSRRFGVLLGSGIALLYAVLYVILQSEDNALIMGSLLIFALLAALMIGTRHFDWYSLTARAQHVYRKAAQDFIQR